MAEILQLEGVRKSYNVGTPIEVEVLHGIDLALGKGEFAALIGPSGSGKSTLLHIVGLLERPTAGRILIDGREIGALDEAGMTELRGRTLGFVFQFHHLLPEFTALENVMMPTLIEEGRYTRAMRERARWLLGKVGLGDALDKRPSALSGGMQQRVAIARALAMNPPLVLADEPTGNLDSHTADDIFALSRNTPGRPKCFLLPLGGWAGQSPALGALMREFNQAEGAAFLIVTHDPRLAARCDRRVELMDGQIYPTAVS